MSADIFTAIAASRKPMPEGEGWHYHVTVQGPRGASYDVEVIARPGKRPLPFSVKLGRRRLTNVSASDRRAEIDRAAESAVAVRPRTYWDQLAEHYHPCQSFHPGQCPGCTLASPKWTMPVDAVRLASYLDAEDAAYAAAVARGEE